MSSEIGLRTDTAARYARQLLDDLGLDPDITGVSDPPALSWRRSGLLKTTGLMLPLPLISHADGVLMALKALTDTPANLPIHGAVLVGERARLCKTVRKGRWCAGGYGKLLNTKDGRIALNPVHDEDWGLIPVWLEEDVSGWNGIEDAVRKRLRAELLLRAAEIGLAVAEDKLPPKPETWFSIRRFVSGAVLSKPVIVDLSGLWAGPLASSLLAMTGADVIKVESPNRPDGARLGHAGFCALINAGKKCVAFDFRDQEDLQRLKTLLHYADVVITASRPRALPQLGIHAEEFLGNKPGKIWARLTAYGQQENRIGFGDDIGISAGLATVMEQAHGEPCFVGDAIADPVNGLHLALVIKASLNAGGGALIDLNMVDILRTAMGDIPDDPKMITSDWQEIANQDRAPLYPMRVIPHDMHDLGADTETVMTALC